MRSIFLPLLLILLFFVSACQSEKKEETAYVEADVVNLANSSTEKMKETIANKDDATNRNYDIPERKEDEPEIREKTNTGVKKIIKDGNITVETKDIYAGKKHIDALLKKLNAYYESEDLQNVDQTISYDLKIRVPADNFETLIASIETGKDEVKSKSIQARDVTEEYVDIQTRLANKRDYLKRYKELLTKASSVKDILAIEENIRTLEEEIESKEGRLNYLNDQVAFSTLDLHLYFQKEYVYQAPVQDKFTERVKKSLSNGWSSIVDFLIGIISVWPFILLILMVVYVVRRIRKKQKERQS